MANNPILVVPISLEALCVGHPDSSRQFVSSSTDFSQLPYRDGENYINYGPNISEYVMAQPFEGDAPLEPGIHLHWALPKALTHGVNPKEDQTGKIDFPAVPNRWLIIRTSANGTTTSWLLESDYLSKTNLGNSVTVPVTPTEAEPQPYRYMGKAFDFETWQEGADLEAEYWPNLTAMGPAGEVAFAAFYPNCSTVFGFYDPLNNMQEHISYRVVGWYAQEQDDPLMQIGQEKRFKDLEDLKKSYNWSWKEENGEIPTRSLCTGAIKNIDWDPQRSYAASGASSETETDEIKVAIGNSPSEALSALMATDLADQPHAERLLNALQIGWLPEIDQYGGLQKMEYDLQQRSFGSKPGGHLWLIKSSTPDGQGEDASSAQTSKKERLPDNLAQALNELNLYQQQYEQAQNQINDQRWQIFADWYKYMVAEYTPDEEHPVDVDHIYAFIEGEIEALNRQVTQTGDIKVKQNGQIDTTQLPTAGTLAHQILMKAQQINQQLEALNHASSGNHLLQTVAAPRYWQPNEPVILVAGNSRYTQPPPRYQGGELSCHLIKANCFTENGLVDKAVILDQATFSGLSETNWTGNPWLPLFLQWEVQYHPIRKMSAGDGYLADTVSACYEADEDYLDLQYDNRHSPTGMESYRSSLILTPHATLNLINELNKYLTAHPKDEGEPLTEEQRQDNALFDELTAIAQRLQNLPVLSQSLGGFNTALLMRKQTLSQPVSDPLAATPGLETFHTRVKNAVDRFNTDAPLPENYYNPIRGGLMSLSQLRLVDAFGQIKAFDAGSIIRAESMIAPGDTTFEQEHIFLAPRLTQPARLQFRWLSAQDDQLEMNSHPASTPVCGWVLPNYLDHSLMIYNNKGHYIGYLMLTPDGEREIWHAAPGQAEVDIRTAFQAENPHLRDFALHIYNDGIPRGFLKTFFQVTDRALDHIDPQNHEQQQTLAVLMGRPLALVRASLKLELRGKPAYCQSWDSFAADVGSTEPQKRATQGFTQVKFPIRLGDVLHINDGLVGYFVEDASGKPNYQFFYAPMAESETGDVLQPKPQTLTLDCDPTSLPVRLTMLIDPRAKVHATSAILPVKAIEIPPEYYLDALKAIEVTFVTAPVISEASQIAFPLPTEASGQWSWISKQDLHTWAEPQKIGPVTDRATLSYTRQQISAGWLQLSHLEENDKVQS